MYKYVYIYYIYIYIYIYYIYTYTHTCTYNKTLCVKKIYIFKCDCNLQIIFLYSEFKKNARNGISTKGL